MTQSRMTKQRALILEVLRAVDTHPTADELYTMVRKRMPQISLGTVYRNLDLLENQGEILCLEQAGAQKRFDGNPVSHQHVRCMQCGKVGDVPAALPVPDLSAVTVKGFTVESIDVLLYGTCDACRGDACRGEGCQASSIL